MKSKKLWKLPKESTERWLQALRSGEYKQGKKSLFIPKDNSFCCLGVWCDINLTEYKKEWEKDEWLGQGNYPIQDSDLVGCDGLPYILACMNDVGPGTAKKELIEKRFKEIGIQEEVKSEYTFNDIADFIEKYVRYV